MDDRGHGLISIGAFAGAGLLAAIPLGNSVCMPVGAVILLALASPRDLWEIIRQRTDVKG